MNTKKTKLITTVGIFSSLSIILYLLDFPIAFLFPSYLKIDFSDVPAILAAIAVNPLAGVAVQGIKNILHFLLKNETGGIGEVANFFAGTALLLPIAYIIRTKKFNNVFAYIAGTLSMVIVANLVNYFITLPLYGVPNDALLSTILYVLVPFNLVKAAIVIFVTALLYKKTASVMNKF